MRTALSLALVALGGLTCPARSVAQPKPPNLPPHLMAPTDPLSPADERKQFTVPPGFDVQLVASEPDIQKPMQLAFDAKGRMWVTSSYHYPFPPANAKATDKLFILSDFDPETGKARKVQTFASDLNIPIGILPLPDCNSCLVSSVGEIRKYTDTDGDGKADKSEVLFSGFGFRDTHGMYNSYTLMPDGWVYACHGFNNDSKVRGKDGHEIQMQSGNTFRFRPDGSRLETWTRGQVNPFGMAVDPWFNLYTADCHSKPITQLVPGAYYESFGKPHDGLGFTPHVTAHPHKSTGLCGLVWYDADHFPKEYKDVMLLGDVVSNCISADKIVWKGSTPVAQERPDFLTSTDRWFRPVDIKLGPDGALYVADFYNKIIGHYEVDLKDPRRDKDRGRIWRIVWKGTDGKAPAPKFAYTDLTTEKPEAIDKLLGHPNLAVRLAATNQLIARDVNAKSVADGSDVYQVHRLWVDAARAWRHGQAAEKAEPRRDSSLLASHALRARRAHDEWGREHPNGEQSRRQQPRLERADAHTLRAAAEWMGWGAKAEHIKPLVEVLAKCPADDTLLRQAARIALRNCLRDNPKAWPDGYDATYADVALAIPQFEAAKYLTVQLCEKKLPAERLPAAAEHITRHGGEAFETVLFAALAEQANADAILAGFRGVQARGAKLNAAATIDLFRNAQKALADTKSVAWGLRVLNALPAVGTGTLKLTPDAVAALTTMLSTKAPDEVRVGAAETLLKYVPADAVEAIRKQLADGTTPEPVRVGCLLALAASNSKDAQSVARDALKDVPYRVAVQIGLSLAGTKEGTGVLFATVKDGKAPQRLLQEKAILERLKSSNLPGWDKQVADLTKNIPPADQRIAAVLKDRATGFARSKGDPKDGAKLFTKHCAACHKIGDAGGKIAPQLDGIGVRGAERLLEDVLDPNRNVDQAFRARSITTTDDRTITALVLRADGEVLVVADPEGKEKRIPLKDIAENRETQLSAMPANFADVIPESEFYNLLAYLLEQKAKEPPKKEK
ncbi:Cytochrome c [Gemmata obscuriglobus]|uniref:Dehydrogenase n=1 Tax=Gemmata obscuriglobus TaxID=114 RepID=A0A2Z3GWT8_9BACT|nr:PVC-type heme-binding CxxCH protein [Gemmata obscuriglobus]AWM35846.1 dehydrogenase [Gemmata obscuriglobus]QEG31612.1 Cytochrome c [Gemmata obscuriglobus]VTS10954.1 membrane-bound dehydrogenase domain-containing protein : Putative membrane-bound dehydrogenase OS=Singulisphaera acidiphila (strain ATCC BAA-1392 / DSM 18658 / VKM B-2454 / MOB10) GN=Sinac_5028 PE=4 SV=1: Cytochrom_C [Gemmata obscuriglobus UQM 2246]